MPIPVWLLKFRTKNARDPRPSELTEKQRRQVRECLKANERLGVYEERQLESLRRIVGLTAVPSDGDSEEPQETQEEDLDSLFRHFSSYFPRLSKHVSWVRKHEAEEYISIISEALFLFNRLLDIESPAFKGRERSKSIIRNLLRRMYSASAPRRKEGTDDS